MITHGSYDKISTKPFSRAAGALYRIMDGVRRAKAAQMLGHTHIRAEVVGSNGIGLGEAEIPIHALRSPKAQIRRMTAADDSRWHRVVQGARRTALPFQSITIQPLAGDEGRGRRF